MYGECTKLHTFFWKMCIFKIKNCTYLCTFFEKLQMLNILNYVHLKNYVFFFWETKIMFVECIKLRILTTFFETLNGIKCLHA